MHCNQNITSHKQLLDFCEKPLLEMSVLHWCGADYHKCGYCKSPNGSISHGMWAQSLTVEDYQAMVDRGWRRSGKYCYKPIMEQTCCPQYTIRCEALKFNVSKSQKKVIRKVNKFQHDGHVPVEEDVDVVDGGCPDLITVKNEEKKKEVRKGVGADTSKPRCKKAKILRRERKQGGHQEVVKPVVVEKTFLELLAASSSGEAALTNKLEVKVIGLDKASWRQHKQREFDVYKKYQVRIHGDAPSTCTMTSFERFLVDSPLQSSDAIFGSFHQQYWLNERLIAVGVIDVLPHCVSSVYFFYDPDFRHLSLGTYSALREIEFTCKVHEKKASVEYYYMGYYIHTCPKMRYKAQLRPSQLLCPETYRWTPAATALPLLDRSPYARFCADATVEDANTCSTHDLQQLKIVDADGYRMLRQYAHRHRHDSTLQTLRHILGATLIRSVFLVDLQI